MVELLLLLLALLLLMLLELHPPRLRGKLRMGVGEMVGVCCCVGGGDAGGRHLWLLGCR